MAWLSIMPLLAQDFDKMTFADTDIQGTARYVSMSGAFAALGGDVSAVKDNPAALGVFRRSELSVSIDWAYTYSTPTVIYNGRNRMGVSQVAWVLNWGRPYQQKGMLFNSLMFQYHRLKSFHQTIGVEGQTSQSQTDWMAYAANAQGVLTEEIGVDQAWNNTKIGWLSLAGYAGGLIQNKGREWTSILLPNEAVHATLDVVESGYSDEYSLSWGTNISNTVYVGLMGNVRVMQYEKYSTYNEAFNAGGAYQLKNTFSATGVGVNVGAGVIYRPVSFVRLGASFISPTWMSLTERNYFDLNSYGIDEKDYLLTSPENEVYTHLGQYQLPMRVATGVAFQIQTIGLVSLEYDYTHTFDAPNQDVHFLRIGTEWVVKKNVFLRAGYAYKSDFLFATHPTDAEALQQRWAYNTVRTDTDFRREQWAQYASIGVGYRNSRWIIDVAYQYKFANAKQYLYEESQPFDMRTSTHRLVLTWAWTYRK